MNLLSCKDAKKLGLNKYFTGKPCLKGHVCERFVSTNSCVDCGREKSKQYHRDHPLKYLEIPYRSPENKDKRLLLTKLWRARNPDKTSSYCKKWGLKNPDKVARKSANRRCNKLQRTPSWADLDAINKIYKDRIKLELETGVPYDTDHIIPLMGKFVCGLHVENNLHNIPSSENRKKSNFHESELWQD